MFKSLGPLVLKGCFVRLIIHDSSDADQKHRFYSEFPRMTILQLNKYLNNIHIMEVLLSLMPKDHRFQRGARNVPRSNLFSVLCRMFSVSRRDYDQ